MKKYMSYVNCALLLIVITIQLTTTTPQKQTSTPIQSQDAVWRLLLNCESQENDEITVLHSHTLLELSDDSITFEELD